MKTNIFADRLTEIIAERNLSHMDFANAGVCDCKMISYYRTGKGYPTTGILIKMCNFLGVSADWLLGLTNSKDLRPEWVWKDGECRCSFCHGRGDPWMHFCPHCGERKDVYE